MAQSSGAEFDALIESALHRTGVVARDDEQRRVLGTSEFLVRAAQRAPNEFQNWLDQRPYATELTVESINARVDRVGRGFADRDISLARLPELQRALRTERNRVQQLLIWRHLAGRAAYAETVRGLSAFADAMVELSLRWATSLVVRTDGTPQDVAGSDQQLVVFALGKLGGGELNLSSDIDLVCAYPEPGTTSLTRKTNQQFFVATVQMLVKLLAEVTADGFVFRVDLRLRPFGDSGALVTSFAALEAYYESNGRDWERYALIKARPCAGNIAAGEAMLARLQPFVYRRYLDFAAIAALRHMRALIQSGQQTHVDNIKLGAGGIRDVEFFAQMLQLIWGGREPQLRTARLDVALSMLVELQLLQVDDRDTLWQHYCLFRNVEHLLQALRDEQTHALPDSSSTRGIDDRVRLAVCMGYADYAALDVALSEARNWVSQLLDRWLLEPGTRVSSAGGKLWFKSELSVDLREEIPGRALILLAELKRSAARSDVAAVGRERLDALMPIVLEELLFDEAGTAHGRGRNADTRLLRVVPLLQNVVRRSAYLVVLAESAPIRAELLDLCTNGGYFPEWLARHPALLDELITAGQAAVLDANELNAELEELLPANATLLPQQEDFDALAQYKCQHQFRALLAFMRGQLDVMQLGDYLSALAEVVIQRILCWAWNGLTGNDKAGLPSRDGFVVFAYGKLGSYEMGSQSDLDLVFVHDWPDAEHNRLHKLVRRFLNYVGMQTYFGALYEVDIRLRPAGRAGTLVSSLAGLRRYQLESAWVWEHQALVRARVVAGCEVLAERVEALRRSVLAQARDQRQTVREVRAMRGRMLAAATLKVARREHSTAAPRTAVARASHRLWNLKNGPGGIVDIEFMVQYLVLVHARKFPGLLEHSDNVRTLGVLAEVGALDAALAHELSADYQALRAAAQRVLLRGDSAGPSVEERQARIHACWQRLMNTEEPE